MHPISLYFLGQFFCCADLTIPLTRNHLIIERRPLLQNRAEALMMINRTMRFNQMKLSLITSLSWTKLPVQDGQNKTQNCSMRYKAVMSYSFLVFSLITIYHL
jgi:hypothetical protein